MKRVWVSILAVTLLLPALAQAKADLSGAPVIRRQILWHEGRFGVSPVIGTTLADDYVQSLLVGLSADYHILEWLAVGLDFRYAIGFKTDMLKQIESELEAARPPGQSSEATISHIEWLVAANIQAIPLYGKFVLFDVAEVAYDFHILAGAGYAGTRILPDDATSRQLSDSTGGSEVIVFGGGFRFFMNDWLGLNLEFRDYMARMVRHVPEYPRGQEIPGKSYEHNLAISLGFTFLFPTETEHRTED